MTDGGYPNKIKRPCLEDVTFSMGPGAHPTLSTELQMPTLTMNPSSADLGVAGQSLLLENNPLDSNVMNSSAMGSPFGVSSTADIGLKGHAIPYYEKNNMPAVDQELQDLLEELTKIQEPSSNDLDLEKILGNKPEEPVVVHHSQAPLDPPAKLPVQMPHMESLGPSKEYASSYSQATDTSLPVLPSSTGINYPIPPTSKQMVSPSSSTAQAQVKNQAQTMLPVTLPPLSVPQWHHAHQLKALAASKQGSATKHHSSNRTWSNLPTPGLSPPYLRVPSPHPPPTQPPPPPPTQPPPPPPFSPQNFTAPCMSSNSLSGSAAQSSSNALLSSMAPSSNAALGPTLTYAPAKLPALPHNQKPQFSPQSSILANLQENQTSGPMAMTPKQRNIYIAQQMTQFQVQEQVISKCIQTNVRPPSIQHMMPPKTELLQDNLIPRLLPPSSHIGVCSSDLKKQQVNTGFPFPISSGLGQDPLNSLGSVCPKAKAVPPEVPLPKLCVNHLGSQSFTSHQLSLPSVPMMSLVFSNSVWAVAAAAVATPVSKESPLSQVDICMLQCSDSSTILFAKAPISVPPTALAFPSLQAVVQANQIAPGVRPGQKVSAALVGPRFRLLGNQSLVQSPAQGPVPVLSTTPLQQSMASCSPLSPVQGLEPPSYIAAIAATSQAPGTLMRASTSPEPQDNVLPQAQSPTDGLISPSSAGSEVNFMEEVLEGSSVAPDEDWVCNLRLIDDILQQRAAAPNATAQNAEQVTQGAEEL
ncbi:hypothetical protein ACRRTK_001697 [Alexandromys fortis]